MGGVKGLVLESDLGHLRRILTLGCPAEFNWEKIAENKEISIRRGNNPSVDKNIEMVEKTLYTEERNNHVVPFLMFLSQTSSVARCATQTIIPGKVNKVDPEKARRIVYAGMV